MVSQQDDPAWFFNRPGLIGTFPKSFQDGRGFPAPGSGSDAEEVGQMGNIPRAAIERILHEGGATRVSAEAKERFAIALEEYGHRFAAETAKIASHAGRKTIRESDVDMAVDLLS